MAIYRGIVRNGVVIPESGIVLPDGAIVQIVTEETMPSNWDEAFTRLHEIATVIATVAPPGLSLSALLEEARQELESDG